MEANERGWGGGAPEGLAGGVSVGVGEECSLWPLVVHPGPTGGNGADSEWIDRPAASDLKGHCRRILSSLISRLGIGHTVTVAF